METMTKKDFKERCSFHTYTGSGQKHHAIFFDWKEPVNENDKRGFKFGVAVDVKRNRMTMKMLFDEFYDWVMGRVQQPSWCVRTKIAADDTQRFKTPLSLNW